MAMLKKAKDLLETAATCDREGMIFQALTYYCEGTELLMQALEKERNPDVHKTYCNKIKSYVERAEDMKMKIKAQVAQSEHVTSIWIPENSERNSYGLVFGKYLNDRVHELLLEEPLLDEKFHFQDLTKFLELVVQNCPNISYVRVTTKPSQRDARYQEETLKAMKDDMDDRLITMTYKIDHDMPVDPKIILNSGKVIKMSRGLHYFKFPKALFNLGLCDYNLRKCYQTHIDVYATDPFYA